MGFKNWLSKFKKKEEYHEIFVEETKEEESMTIKAKKALHKELQALGIFPKTRHQVGHVVVDFGFPSEKIAVEVIGEMNEEETAATKKRYSTLKAFGWKVYGFSAEDVYMHTKDIASKVKKIIGYHQKN
jgi:very-short-patch-repair endonuclease